MAKAAKIAQLAERAGVSTATVDRVLHGRGGYSAKSKEAVSRAIQELGYGTLSDHLTEHEPRYKFIVFVPALECAFQTSIMEAAKLAAESTRGAHIVLDRLY